jgi:hypothetical protein
MDPEESKAFHATLTKLVIAARSWSDIDSLVPRDLVDHHK